MKRTAKILGILMAAAMLLPSQVPAADIAPKSQTQQSSMKYSPTTPTAAWTGWRWPTPQMKCWTSPAL